MRKTMLAAAVIAGGCYGPARADVIHFTGVADAMFVRPGATAATSTASFTFTPSTATPDGQGGYIMQALSGSIAFSGLLSIFGMTTDSTAFDAATTVLYIDFNASNQHVTVGQYANPSVFIAPGPNADGFRLYNPPGSNEDSLTTGSGATFSGAYFTNTLSVEGAAVPEPASLILLAGAVALAAGARRGGYTRKV